MSTELTMDALSDLYQRYRDTPSVRCLRVPNVYTLALSLGLAPLPVRDLPTTLMGWPVIVDETLPAWAVEVEMGDGQRRRYTMSGWGQRADFPRSTPLPVGERKQR